MLRVRPSLPTRDVDGVRPRPVNRRGRIIGVVLDDLGRARALDDAVESIVESGPAELVELVRHAGDGLGEPDDVP